MATEVLIRGVAALGVARLRELAASAGLNASSGDARTLADRLVGSLERPEDLSHRGLTEADIEAIGRAVGVGARAAWRPRIPLDEFERLPFYQKPSYDQDVWAALLVTRSAPRVTTPRKPHKAKKPRTRAKAKKPARRR